MSRFASAQDIFVLLFVKVILPKYLISYLSDEILYGISIIGMKFVLSVKCKIWSEQI